MSDEHGGACCEECAQGRKCAGDSCGLSKPSHAKIRGAMRVPYAFTMPGSAGTGQFSVLENSGLLNGNALFAGRNNPYGDFFLNPPLNRFDKGYNPASLAFAALDRSNTLNSNALFAQRGNGNNGVGYALAIGPRPIGVIRPAGQYFDTTQTSLGTDPLNDAQTAAIDAALASGDSAAVDAALNAQAPAPRADTSQQWLNLAGSAIHETGSTIVAAIQSADATERNRLDNATRLEIARLMNNPASTAAARQQQAQMLASLAALSQQLRNPPPPPPPKDNTVLYVVGGVTAVAVIALLVTRNSGHRTNPVVGGRDNKHGHWESTRRSRRRRGSRARA